jgi:prepilin-type N-terminal cleavage/methylation domain-containing protein
MKLARLLPHLKSQLGFTMIELLVVIAVIGVLAVAVLSSINPIEQINKGRDTRTRSDAAQLINAVDRYYAIHEKYPWNVDHADPAYTAGAVEDLPNAEFSLGSIDGTGVSTAVEADWAWLYHLTDTAEVKAGFVNRIVADNKIVLFKIDGYNESMYSCFLPTSNAFKQEAMENCADGVTPGGTGSQVDAGDIPGGIETCPDEADIEAYNLICLP